MSEVVAAMPSVALVFGNAEAGEHLRGELAKIGVEVVCTANVAELDPATLETSGARVVVVNLDDELSEQLDRVYDALDEDRFRVVFNDPEVSDALSGWDESRWLRHLAAKLRDDGDVDPPRPADTGVPSPQQTASDEWVNEALDVLGDAPVEPAAMPDVARAVDADVGIDVGDFESIEFAGESSLADETTDHAASVAAAIDTFEAPTEPPTEPTPGAESTNTAATSEAELVSGPTAAAGEAEAPPAAVDDGLESTFDIDLEDVPVFDESAARRSDTADEGGEGDDNDALAAELSAMFDNETLAALDAAATAPSEPPEPEPKAPEPDPSAAADAAVASPPQPEPVAAPVPAPVSAEPPPPPPPPAIESPPEGLKLVDADAPLPEPAATPVPAAALQFDFSHLSLVALEPDTPNRKTWEGAEHRLDPEEREALKRAAAAAAKHREEKAAEAADADADATDEDVVDGDAGVAPTVADDHHDDATGEALANDELSLPEPDVEPAPEPAAHAAETYVDASAAEIPVAIDDFPAPASQPPAVAEPEPEPVPDDVAAAATTDDGDGFGVELVAAADYLAPDAPAVDPEHAIITPELIPIDDAVAPEVEGEGARFVSAGPRPVARLIVLGASIGGPDAVREFLSGLPQHFPATFVLVQHLGSEFMDLMISQLGKSGALPVRQAANGDHSIGGEVLVVPNGYRLRVARSGEVELAPIEDGDEHATSIHATMAMAADVFGPDAMAIIFSGMSDGAVDGAEAIAARGGIVWAQDPASCVVSNMVDAVIEAGKADFVAAPTVLAEHLIETLASEINP